MGVPIHELKKKKDNLLGTFRTNLKKKMSSMKSGSGVEDVCQPIWIFYDVMAAFLTDIYESTSLINSEENIRPEVCEEAGASNERASDLSEEGKNNVDVDVPPIPPQSSQKFQGQ
ncbi:unnamed protein product [Acanthoscelides obtectus]|uniref:Uncharacterized protein n=1 Tax=Acanthoscelides obtectus TaxID=200917 RepID=A0A9P0K7N6_ACAOB|nr:unnamed protein product [Acanthoscelides obtectus]CAK1632337.1 hypothetical protein AOBTE_LOCUS7489 [Acanthoscelides obtectus]